jgi:hypothetical protein
VKTSLNLIPIILFGAALLALPVTTVGSAAFYQVSALTSVTFGTNVTTIAPNAIFQCPSISSVAIPAASQTSVPGR